ncbi:hypothetical protein HOY80DRAFT_1025588 [Tuber brumale]|nr:hypothetical protein HOY80DRAFT_1025588 [Tuber brumale]
MNRLRGRSSSLGAAFTIITITSKIASPAPSSAPATGSLFPPHGCTQKGSEFQPASPTAEATRAPAANRQKPPAPPPPPAATVISAKTAPTTASSVARTGSATSHDHEGGWHEFKLTTTKTSLMNGFRHQVMRMQSKRELDPTDSNQFTRPVRLHRRDPGGPLPGAKEAAAANKAAEAGEKAKDKVGQGKKDAEKRANLGKFAPFGGAQKQKQKVFHNNTQQVFRSNDADKTLRYEEYFPLFIEDYDNKNTWLGELESSLSKGVFAMFMFEEGAFRMVPVEQWYKFQEKNEFRTMTSEEAELEMKKNTRPPRWLIKRAEHKESQQRELGENARANKALFTRKGDKLKSEADNDDLDFEDDQFADDEEAPIMEGEKLENKEIEEQQSANLSNARDERDWEKEEIVRKRLEDVPRKHGKKVKKALVNREGNFTYESDSDANPYGITGDGDSKDEEETACTEEGKPKEVERKKAEAAAEKEKTDPRKSKAAPVAAPAFTSTPGVTAAAAPQGKPGPELKREGTPPHPESGTESRKNPKRNTAANNITGNSTALPILGGADKKRIVKQKVARESHYQIASSTPSPSPPLPAVGTVNEMCRADLTAGECIGDEWSGRMSHGPGSKKQRVMITTGGRSLSYAAVAADSRQGTPGASRLDSPAATAGAGNTSAPMARGTPGPLGTPLPPPHPGYMKNILSSNPDGVTLKFIADKFKNRAGDAEAKKEPVSSLRSPSELTDKRTYKLKEGVGA